MADRVHQALESMLPELEDLEKRGLFTKAEIKEIVKKRRDYEYLLRRHSTLKQDYLRYIEYETKVESLRKLRKKGMVRDLHGSGGKWQPSLCDLTCSRRITLIYELAVRKFKGDLNLWLQYLEFCRSHSPRKLQKVVTRCLQLHPNVPGLWMYAAAWEFEHNVNVKAARALMQRGLRVCPRAENLWVEYFRMELTYLDKLKARRSVLGLGPTTSSIKDEGAFEENEVSLEDKLSFKITQTIFKNAVAAVPASLAFRQCFLGALDSFEFEHKEELEEQIYASITADFPTDERSWDWLARRQVHSEHRAIQVYEEAVKRLPSTLMHELYANYLMGRLDAKTLVLNSGLGFPSINGRSNELDVASNLLQLYEKCSAVKKFSEVLAKGHVELLMRSGRLEETLDLVRKFCSREDLNKSASLWEWRVSLEMNGGSSATDQHSVDRRATVAKLFQEALNNVSFAEAKRLWLMAMEFHTGQENDHDVLIGMLESALSGGSGGYVGAQLACTCVNWIFHSRGTKEARKIYRRFLALPGPSPEFFKVCINIEAQGVETGAPESLEFLRKLFNEAVESFGEHDTDLWMEYHKAELKAGNMDGANNVYWRAKKTLKDPTSFVERHLTLRA